MTSREMIRLNLVPTLRLPYQDIDASAGGYYSQSIPGGRGLASKNGALRPVARQADRIAHPAFEEGLRVLGLAFAHQLFPHLVAVEAADVPGLHGLVHP